jgi:hypothetical protein
VAAGQISSDTLLPHLCGSEEVSCTFRALSVRSQIATRQRFVSFFMQKARDPTLLKKIHSFSNY